MNTMLRLAAAVVLAASSTYATSAAAQDYPTKAIRVIVPLTPGSGADIAGRIVVRYMGDAFGKPLVVENRPGAGGVWPETSHARATDDGAVGQQWSWYKKSVRSLDFEGDDLGRVGAVGVAEAD